MTSTGSAQRNAADPLGNVEKNLSAFGERTEISKDKLVLLRKSFHKSIVKSSDMNTELQSEAIDFIISAIDKFEGNYEAAARLVKSNMDRKFGPTWHCIIGEGFGFQVTHQVNHMCFVFYLGNVATLLFKN